MWWWFSAMYHSSVPLPASWLPTRISWSYWSVVESTSLEDIMATLLEEDGIGLRVVNGISPCFFTFSLAECVRPSLTFKCFFFLFCIVEICTSNISSWMLEILLCISGNFALYAWICVFIILYGNILWTGIILENFYGLWPLIHLEKDGTCWCSSQKFV